MEHKLSSSLWTVRLVSTRIDFICSRRTDVQEVSTDSVDPQDGVLLFDACCFIEGHNPLSIFKNILACRFFDFAGRITDGLCGVSLDTSLSSESSGCPEWSRE